MHRDKPFPDELSSEEYDEFPVCTGINRFGMLVVQVLWGVPCMHRDKPATQTFLMQ